MNASRRTGFLLLCAAAAVAGLAWIAAPFDRAILVFLHREEPSALDAVQIWVHRNGPSLCLGAAALLALGVLLRAGDPLRRRDAMLLLAVPPLSVAVVAFLKRAVDRPRPVDPDGVLSGIRTILDLPGNDAMPSGHAASAVALAAGAALLLRRRALWLPLGAVAAGMMWNRLDLGVHHPSDVLAGAAIPLALYGACLSVLDRRPVPAVLTAAPVLAGAGLLLTALLGHGPAGARDPATFEAVPGFSLEPSPWRTAFEPLFGPVQHLAQIQHLRPFLLRALIAAAAGLAAVLLLPRRAPRRLRVARAAFAGILGLAWGFVFFTGRIPLDRFVAEAREGVFVDLHLHGSDPVDGAISLDRLRARLDSRGVAVYAITNHDAWSPDPAAIPGVEWSGFRHPAQPYVHLLILGGRGLRVLDAEELAPADGRGDGAGQALEAVRIAKEAGSLVIVAHYWTTRRAMEAAGSLDWLPSPEEFAGAGVDGFEVANRSPAVDRRDRRWIAEIDRLCRERNLLRISVSDDHGIPAGSPCITFIEGVPRDSGGDLRPLVMEALVRRQGVVPLVFSDRRRPEPDVPGFDLIAVPYRYFGSLTVPARLSWFAWILAGWLVLGGRRERARG